MHDTSVTNNIKIYWPNRQHRIIKDLLCVAKNIYEINFEHATLVLVIFGSSFSTVDNFAAYRQQYYNTSIYSVKKCLKTQYFFGAFSRDRSVQQSQPGIVPSFRLSERKVYNNSKSSTDLS